MAKFDINSMRTDDQKKKGVWIDLGSDASICVASFDTKEFALDLVNATKAYTKIGREVPVEEQKTIMVNCLAKHILVDWKGFYDGEEELPYSYTNAVRFLTEIDWLLTTVINEAKNQANFRMEQSKAIEGNS